MNDDRDIRDPLAALLADWRLWLLGALLGALLGWGLFQLLPPDYRARATVVVDMNIEESWDYFPDRELFQLIGRETERLLLLAWSDEVLAQAAAQVAGIQRADLRAGVLQLSQPSDGGWRFYADLPKAEQAQALAAAWAASFVEAAYAAVEVQPEMEAARAELSALAAEGLLDEDPQVRALMDEVHFLAEHSQGISPYTELHLSEAADLPLERTPSLASYLLAGSLIGALGAALLTLFRQRP